MVTTNGWPRLYDRLFGWRNQTRTAGDFAIVEDAMGESARKQLERPYGGSTNGVDLGMATLNRGTEHGARSTAYVFLAVLVQWVLAAISFAVPAVGLLHGMNAFAVARLSPSTRAHPCWKTLAPRGAEHRTPDRGDRHGA